MNKQAITKLLQSDIPEDVLIPYELLKNNPKFALDYFKTEGKKGTNMGKDTTTSYEISINCDPLPPDSTELFYEKCGDYYLCIGTDSLFFDTEKVAKYCVKRKLVDRFK